ncbi:MAG: sulfotransferase family 2 domain-containing protein, partial [Pseudomonadota bacterium]
LVPAAPHGHLHSPLSLLSATRNNNLVYNLNQKAGCTTVLNFMVMLELGALPKREIDVHDQAPDVLLRWGSEEFEDILLGENPFVFTFVRNPYRRFLSGFFDKIAADRDANFEELRQDLRSEWGFPQKIDENNVEDAIDRFLDNLESRFESHHGIFVEDPHFNPQTHNINFSQVRYDFIGQVERLSEGLEIVLEHSQLQCDTGSLFERPFNRTRSTLYDRYELSAGQKRRLEEFYAADFTNFASFYPLHSEQGSARGD